MFNNMQDRIEQWFLESGDSMDNQMSMDTSSSPMSQQGGGNGPPNMSGIPSPADIKPDISQIQVSVSSSGNGGYNAPLNAGPPPPPHQGYGHYQGHPPSTVGQGMYYGGGMGGMGHPSTSQMSPASNTMSPQGQPLQSPTLSSMSPGSMQSPSSTMGSPGPHGMGQMIPGMPQGMAAAANNKHICAICGDRASGKHYGVHSCEGCKGFFKRTVRKDLSYACRDDKKCLIDKRQRNRCQFCRYNKCLSMGMKREAVQDEHTRGKRANSIAVQEERQRTKDGRDGEVESTSSAQNDMPVDRILDAERSSEPHVENYVVLEGDAVTSIVKAADKQLFALVDWAKRIPHYLGLPMEDQVLLLRAGWNELLISGFSHRSVAIEDGILLGNGVHITRHTAQTAGVGPIFDRVLSELVSKMRDMKMDRTELGCLRAIVLFNPDAKNLKAVNEVEALREKCYASLEEYCKTTYPEEPGRFAKLLLRLPALRSIGLKCMEHLFFFKMIGDTPIDTFLLEMLDGPSA